MAGTILVARRAVYRNFRNAGTATPALLDIWQGLHRVSVRRAEHRREIYAEEGAMVRMFVHHRVEDYARWRAAYDAFDEERRGMGVIDAGVYSGVEDPLDVTVTHDFATIDEAKAFAESTQLKSVMHDAGVIGAPEIWFSAQA